MLQTETWVLLSSAAGLGIAYLVNYVLGAVIWRRRRKGEPEIVKGHPIWGSGNDFSVNAVDFLHKTQASYGDVFTIRLINKYLTIIADPHSLENLTKENNFDFDPIQKQVNKNVFGFVLVDAKKMIKDAGRTLRGNQLETAMSSFAKNLNHSCELVVQKSVEGAQEWQRDGLRAFASKTLFHAIFHTIFGSDQHQDFNSPKLFHNLDKFHHYFNLLWLGVPSWLFPEVSKCFSLMSKQPSPKSLLERADTSEYLRASIEFMQKMGHSDADIAGHNLVFIHVNYNTFRLAFWVLANIIENPTAREALMDELNDAVDQRLHDETNSATFTHKDLEGLKVLDSICNESLRLSAGVFMVRYVNKDTMFKTENSGKEYLIREGDRVAIYPPAIQKDPEIYEDPLVFKYDRFIDATFYKNGKKLKHPLPTFGTLCPGKRYAILQLKWYILQVMTQFDLKNESDFKAELATEYHGHEILPPRKDLDVAFRAKENHPTLVLDA